ncbi:hypothetical protein BHE74_00047511 [Ensete ventricosum]|nr:hypothetical protein BHE74_00047511 [Ensete ventricosum]RZR85550.1 hypothetical protein BHM03_00012557 [Ensete ventricosum]
MIGGYIVVEVTTNSSTEPLLPSRASCARKFSCTCDKFRSFRFYLRWIYIDQFDTRYTMVSWSLFLLRVFIPIVSHFVLSYAPTHRAYNMVI